MPCRFWGQEVLIVANRSRRAAASGLAWSCSFCASIDLHNLLHEMEGRSVGFRSLGEAWCDTTTDVGRLMLTITGVLRSSNDA
jgi:DNA invertase Pin-like site-specific DNA recombinase